MQKSAEQNHKILNRRTETKRDLQASPAVTQRKPRQSKAKEPPDSNVNVLKDYFKLEYERTHGTAYYCNEGRDGKAIKGLLATFSVDDLKRAITDYLNDSLSWMDNPTWTIPGFERQANKYMAAATPTKQPKRRAGCKTS